MTGFEKPSNTCKKGFKVASENHVGFNISLLYNTIKANKLDLSKQTIFSGLFFLSIFCYLHDLSSPQDNTQKLCAE